MNFSISVPSKTFLLGEYVALQAGPTLVLNSSPRFNLTIKTTSKDTPVIFENMAKESPAGKFILQQADFFRGFRLSFIDPHNGLGGFGASSAQFAMVVFLQKLIANSFGLFDFISSHKELLEQYWSFAWDGKGTAPSGADVIAQVQGGISYFYKAEDKLVSLAWPFADVNYYLLRTGNKIPTHQHLKNFVNSDIHKLTDIVFAGLQHLQTKNAVGFTETINAYASAMKELDLVADKTLQLLKLINTRHEVLAAKGCGALGADVILVLVENKHHDVFVRWLSDQSLNLVVYGNEADKGISVESFDKLE